MNSKVNNQKSGMEELACFDEGELNGGDLWKANIYESPSKSEDHIFKENYLKALDAVFENCLREKLENDLSKALESDGVKNGEQ